MVNRNLIRGLDVDSEELDRELELAMAGGTGDQFEWGGGDLAINSVVDGRILRVDDDFVLVDVGYKSEGISRATNGTKAKSRRKPGQVIKVLIEDVEDIQELLEESRGMIALSKRKAEKIEAWMKVMETVHEGDVVTGVATRKIKGGLLVDVSA